MLMHHLPEDCSQTLGPGCIARHPEGSIDPKYHRHRGIDTSLTTLFDRFGNGAVRYVPICLIGWYFGAVQC